MTTHPEVSKQPSSLDEVLRFGDLLFDRSQYAVVQPAEGRWDVFARLCREDDAPGNLVPDARLASMAIEAGC